MTTWLAIFVEGVANHDAFDVLVLDYVPYCLAKPDEVVLCRPIQPS